jgi:hypothetical protein
VLGYGRLGHIGTAYHRGYIVLGFKQPLYNTVADGVAQGFADSGFGFVMCIHGSVSVYSNINIYCFVNNVKFFFGFRFPDQACFFSFLTGTSPEPAFFGRFWFRVLAFLLFKRVNVGWFDNGFVAGQAEDLVFKQGRFTNRDNSIAMAALRF